MDHLITVEDALRIVLEHKKDFGTELIPLQNAIGRILRETIHADRDFPPYDRVTMDGIGIQFGSFESGQRDFPIEGVAAAGAVQQRLNDPKSCLEVMTGAVMPGGADTVIRYEDLDISNGIANKGRP